METRKTSLLPLFFLLTPAALLYPLPSLRLLWLLVLLIHLSGSVYSRSLKKRLRSARLTPADSLFHGEDGYVELLVENGSRFPAANILVEDRPDFDLGYAGRQRFLISLSPGEKRRIRYRIRGGRRGQFLIRGWQIGATDIFGQFPWSAFHDVNDIITVYPRIFPLYGLYRNYRQPFGNIRNRYPIFEEPSRMDGIRPYQTGDPIRNVNWKQSARKDRLLVNTRMPSISRRTLILLNLYAPDYDFRYREFYQELALEMTASIADLLRRQNQEFGLLVRGELRELHRMPDDAGIAEERREDLFRIDPGTGGRHLREMLELLAKIHPQAGVSLQEELSVNNFEPGGRATVLILTPDLDRETGARIGALKQSGIDPAVILFGPNIRKGYGLAGFNIPVSSTRREEGLLLLEKLHE